MVRGHAWYGGPWLGRFVYAVLIEASGMVLFRLPSALQVKQRHVDRPLQFALQLSLQERSNQAGGRQRG